MANHQQEKETTGNRQRAKNVQEPKYNDGEYQGEDNKTYNLRSTSTRAKIETKNSGKEHKINSELD